MMMKSTNFVTNVLCWLTQLISNKPLKAWTSPNPKVVNGNSSDLQSGIWFKWQPDSDKLIVSSCWYGVTMGKIWVVSAKRFRNKDEFGNFVQKDQEWCSALTYCTRCSLSGICKQFDWLSAGFQVGWTFQWQGDREIIWFKQ